MLKQEHGGTLNKPKNTFSWEDLIDPFEDGREQTLVIRRDGKLFHPYCYRRDCKYVDPEVLKEIESFMKELEACGYFVFRNKRWDLLVSKIKSIAHWASIAVPPWKNAGIRGLIFGYLLFKILKTTSNGQARMR